MLTLQQGILKTGDQELRYKRSQVILDSSSTEKPDPRQIGVGHRLINDNVRRETLLGCKPSDRICYVARFRDTYGPPRARVVITTPVRKGMTDGQEDTIVARYILTVKSIVGD